jgi:hypothetical protein
MSIGLRPLSVSMGCGIRATWGAREVTVFLSHLAVERDVAAATQQQALSALLFLYWHVLEIDLPWLTELVRPRKPARLPTALNQDEVARLLDSKYWNALRGGLLRSTVKKGQKCWRSCGAASTMAAWSFKPISAAFRLL